ncbi:hypothetical protein [Pseudomonas aeruginosa]|uniref:hypothetical protein n=1 Tax=Pseudomonas aeruginosa TaxID=287 RepID=UPI00106B3771|nr:hypothetical protein [Pseudomonas aeruginosa]HBO7987864.1 hypothetical protein [Pseudomonas aeruginosa]HBO8740677.1 hypothetical protein [Pseudomonas aeruginosa]HDY6109488.1 hypothetical protein [Pseudomonas aeruginosa]HDY6417810.1 hypothetical protein [Pseudomonas aeruginosa]HDY6504524.1 hypothetical protein [Pseudomonas aeruginosa]
MLNRVFWLLASLFLSPLALAANNDVDLGSPGDGPLAAFAGFMQELVNFVGGPGVLFIVFVSAAAGIGLWVMAPKSGSAAVAWIARVCVGGIALFNLALLLAWYQGF